LSNVFETAGEVSVLGFQAVTDLFSRPFEGEQIRRQLAEIGSKSLPLVIASGFSLGAVLTLHTRPGSARQLLARLAVEALVRHLLIFPAA
jgi:phospholipid/cholesterol/gamma-HCH transport system permease protein